MVSLLAKLMKAIILSHIKEIIPDLILYRLMVVLMYIPIVFYGVNKTYKEEKKHKLRSYKNNTITGRWGTRTGGYFTHQSRTN